MENSESNWISSVPNCTCTACLGIEPVKYTVSDNGEPVMHFNYRRADKETIKSITKELASKTQ